MKILIVNQILYTNETSNIKKVESIKDTMIYAQCLAFKELGHDITLAACEEFKPTNNEEYPFEIKWMKAKMKKIFKPNVLPYCAEIKKIAKNGDYDLIITSEVFQIASLLLAIHQKDKLIVWHELAKHNNLMHQIPSKFWYGIIAKIFLKNILIVPRSIEARNFISKYCNNVNSNIIDHGVNFEKFKECKEKDNQFAIVSQLIGRKQIDKILNAFSIYLRTYNNDCNLYIIGKGEEKDNLVNLAKKLKIENKVIFTGQMNHSEMIEILKKARALLVYTRQDNNMVSIVESIALDTPIITTSVPYNASYIKENNLGIVDDNWDEKTLNEIVEKNSYYIENCSKYRNKLSTKAKAQQFIDIFNNRK